MKIKLIFFLIFSQLIFSQHSSLTNLEIEKYVLKINSLQNKSKLKKVTYSQMSSCGGSLIGYYLNKQLVLIDATYNAELGFQNKKLYLQNKNYVKIEFFQHTAKWEKFSNQNPAIEYDSTKMTYEDTFTIINLSPKINFKKFVNKKFVSNKVEINLIENLISCGNQMIKELAFEHTN